MARRKILSPDDIEEAKRLKNEEKMSNRRIADFFEVGKTTIWDNIYAVNVKPRKRKKYQRFDKCEKCGILYNIKVQEINKKLGNLCLGCVIQYFKEQDLTSKEISDFIGVELKLVNKNWYIVKSKTHNIDD